MTYHFSNTQDLANRYALDYDFTGHKFRATLKPDLELADAAAASLTVDHTATAGDVASGFVDIVFPAADLAGLTGRYYLDCKILAPGPDSTPLNIPPDGPDIIVFGQSATRRLA